MTGGKRIRGSREVRKAQLGTADRSVKVCGLCGTPRAYAASPEKWTGSRFLETVWPSAEVKSREQDF